jgi:hypothetical protein
MKEDNFRMLYIVLFQFIHLVRNKTTETVTSAVVARDWGGCVTRISTEDF